MIPWLPLPRLYHKIVGVLLSHSYLHPLISDHGHAPEEEWRDWGNTQTDKGAEGEATGDGMSARGSRQAGWGHQTAAETTQGGRAYIGETSSLIVVAERSSLQDPSSGVVSSRVWDLIPVMTLEQGTYRHWTRLVIVKDQSSHLLYLKWCIKYQTCESLDSIGHCSCKKMCKKKHPCCAFR